MDIICKNISDTLDKLYNESNIVTIDMLLDILEYNNNQLKDNNDLGLLINLLESSIYNCNISVNKITRFIDDLKRNKQLIFDYFRRLNIFYFIIYSDLKFLQYKTVFDLEIDISRLFEFNINNFDEWLFHLQDLIYIIENFNFNVIDDLNIMKYFDFIRHYSPTHRSVTHLSKI